MKQLIGLTALGCVLFASTARASDGEEIAPGTLPPAVDHIITEFYPGAELLHAWKETENGEECYVVRIREGDRVIDLYAAPDGRMLARKLEVFSANDVPRLLQGSLLVLLLGGVPGVASRWMVQVVRGKKLSVLAEWLAAWFGATLAVGLLASQLATVPREKDWLILSLMCAIWGAYAASIVEILALIVQSIRGYRPLCRRWLLGISLAAVVFLTLTVPVDRLRKHRENEYYRALALRPPANQP